MDININPGRNAGGAVQDPAGATALNDQTVAYDLLISAKSGVKNIASALTEVASPNVRSALRKQLDDAINLHERVTSYMLNKGWYYPYNVSRQIQQDLRNAEMAMQMR
ncbi:MAG: spore coat protein [Bacillota bacterium]|nr:spore coat protein [Bacillota bacterium]